MFIEPVTVGFERVLAVQLKRHIFPVMLLIQVDHVGMVESAK